MKIKIANGLVIDPKNKRHDKLDILFEDNEIIKIAKKITDEVDYELDATDCIVSPGFVDVHPNFCDPGVTSREDLKTGSMSAVKGGFTHVILGTDNKPAPSQCNVIEYINRFSDIMPVNMYTAAAVTEDRLGAELADIQFLSNHGAYVFSDGLRPMENKLLLEKALNKCKLVNIPMALFSLDLKGIKVRGINSGKVSEKLGIKGAEPVENEIKDLKTNLELVNKTGAKVEFMYLSTKEAYELFASYKKENPNIIASVQVLSFMLNEEALNKKGTNAKIIPPLRVEADRKACIKAIADNTIDIISSNHVPCTEEDKSFKLKEANAGSIGLETMLGCIGAKLVDDKKITWDNIIEKISLNPARFYGLDEDGAGSIDIGNPVNITIFKPDEKWTLEIEAIASKSKNSPLIGEKLVGKVKYTICEGRLVYKDRSMLIVEEDEEK